MNCPQRFLSAALLVCISVLTGCGGGGSGGTPTPTPPQPDFTITTLPGTLTVTIGATGAKLTASIVPQNGFTGSVDLTLSTLPTGISAMPSSWSTSAGQSQDVIFTADVKAAVTTFQATISGTSGSLNKSAAIQGKVAVPPDSAVIGAGGGTVTASSGAISGVKLVVPPDALGQNTLISMRPLASIPANSETVFFTGGGVEILPSGTELFAPAMLSVPFQDTNHDGVLDGTNIPVRSLGLVGYDADTQSSSLGNCSVDKASQLLACEISGFSTFDVYFHRYQTKEQIGYCIESLPYPSDGSDLAAGIRYATQQFEWKSEADRSQITFVETDCANAKVKFTATDLFWGKTCDVYGRTGAVLGLCPGGKCTIYLNNNPCQQTGHFVGYNLQWTSDPKNTNRTLLISHVAAHELGHVLGLPHISVPGVCESGDCRGSSASCATPASIDVPDVMARYINPTCPVTSLGTADALAYRQHYGLIYAESGGTSSQLYTVDPIQTGADLPIGPIRLNDGSAPVITDIAQSSDGKLYGISYDRFYSIDPMNGHAQLIGPLGGTGYNSLSFDTNDKLYAASLVGDWATVKTSTGAATIIGDFGSSFSSSGDLVFVPTFPVIGGVAYATVRTSFNANDQLVKVNPSTGAATQKMDLGASNVYGFAWVSPNMSGSWTACLATSPVLCTDKFFALTTDAEGKGSLYLVDLSGTTQLLRPLSFSAYGASGVEKKLGTQ